MTSSSRLRSSIDQPLEASKRRSGVAGLDWVGMAGIPYRYCGDIIALSPRLSNCSARMESRCNDMQSEPRFTKVLAALNIPD
jgi:hypothetical protein